MDMLVEAYSNLVRNGSINLAYSYFLISNYLGNLFGQLSMGANDVAARLNSSGFLRTQGFIGGKWVDAYGGKTIQV